MSTYHKGQATTKTKIKRLYAALDALIDYEGEIKASTYVNSHSYSEVCDALRGMIDELEAAPLLRKKKEA